MTCGIFTTILLCSCSVIRNNNPPTKGNPQPKSDKSSTQDDRATSENWLTIGSESVSGIVVESSCRKNLRVISLNDAWIRFRLGILAEQDFDPSTMSLKLEYKPSGESDKVHLIFEPTVEQISHCINNWQHFNFSLEEWSPLTGELSFVVSVNEIHPAPFKLMWGHPSIYYPNRKLHRNILLIGVDTLRADAISPMGDKSKLTPYLEKFSSRATIFKQTRSQSPWTLPSFASMITGQLPSRIEATIFTSHLPENERTIGEILHENKYSTATICSNTWIGNKQSGFRQGMDEMWYEFDAPASKVTQAACDFISRSKDQNWFCFVHYNDPHAPYNPPEKFIPSDVTKNTGKVIPPFRPLPEWKSGEIIPSEPELKAARMLYDAEVSAVDEAVGTLIEFIDANKLTDDTLIIFASDHGEEFMEHGSFEHGQSQYDELVHVPLMVSGQGFAEGITIDSPAGNTDIAPTILNYANVNIPQEMIGTPLYVISKSAPVHNRLFYGEDNMWSALCKYVLEWPYKLIMNFHTGEFQLFNLESDPGEKNDISQSNDSIVSRLSTEIINSMMPAKSTWFVWITPSHDGKKKIFSGTLASAGGFADVQTFNFDETDVLKQEGNTIEFQILSPSHGDELNKHLVIEPTNDQDKLSMTLIIDGQSAENSFYPRGNFKSEPPGSVTIDPNDFPAGINLPVNMNQNSSACFIWFVRGYKEDDIQLDQQSKEQLKALGYIN